MAGRIERFAEDMGSFRDRGILDECYIRDVKVFDEDNVCAYFYRDLNEKDTDVPKNLQTLSLDLFVQDFIMAVENLNILPDDHQLRYFAKTNSIILDDHAYKLDVTGGRRVSFVEACNSQNNLLGLNAVYVGDIYLEGRREERVLESESRIAKDYALSDKVGVAWLIGGMLQKGERDVQVDQIIKAYAKTFE